MDYTDSTFLRIDRNNSRISVSDLLIKHLDNHNITNVFSVINDSNIHLIDSILQNKNFKIKFFNSPDNCIYAALGYSNYTNDIPLIVLPNGKLFFDALSGIASAHLDSKKMLIVFGQSNIDNKNNSRQIYSKSFDFSSIIPTLSKFYKRIERENEVSKDIEQAIFAAKSNRPGVSVIEVPLNFQGKVINNSKQRHFKHISQNINTIKSEIFKLDQVEKMIVNSKNPCVVLGNGSNTIDNRNVINRFISKFPGIFLTTRRGTDLIDFKNKKNFGRVGVYGNRYANIIIDNSDLIIFLGCGMKQSLTGRNVSLFCQNATKVLVDIDSNELSNINIKFDLKIQISSFEFITKFLDRNINYKEKNTWIKYCKKIKNTYPFKREGYKNNKKINPYIFFKNLSIYVPDKSILFVDGLEITNYFIQGFENKKFQRIFFSSSLDQKGFSPLSVLGVPNLKKNNKIFSITDYFSFINLFKDSDKLIESKNNFNFIVLFNIHNSAVRDTQKDFFGKRMIGSDIFFEDKSLLKKFSQNINFQTYFFSLKNLDLNQINFNKNNIIILDCDHMASIKPKINFTQTDDGNWIADPLYKMYPYIGS